MFSLIIQFKIYSFRFTILTLLYFKATDYIYFKLIIEENLFIKQYYFSFKLHLIIYLYLNLIIRFYLLISNSHFLVLLKFILDFIFFTLKFMIPYFNRLNPFISTIYITIIIHL